MDSAFLAIISVLLFFIVALTVYFLWPWKASTPTHNVDTIPKNKNCSISGEVIDYSGSTSKVSSTLCTQCIKYLTKTSEGCFPMQYDGDSKCAKYGDPEPCPTKSLR
jgi:hypothetical protein